ncbi:DUF72 domain-containing protein [Paenibacillus sediminis]|uniref:Uncharacterized protein YecE (DUF72 family) n=1 Tax=Paenibacillus sediminis TaxID=664909 RepID=A0ABS4H1X2_9BACL|nr:DUF72 domain-containing protein [Paenibacillus sediminis]MBP1936262.1 uncharacterized protein YecE (DUF72 family) [Paenibacillus sediminis]
MQHNEPSTSRIQIGLAGWGDHEDLYGAGIKAPEKLNKYSRYLPIVELDSSFYAIPTPERMKGWSTQTPDHFGFIVKAYQGMTGHTRGNIPFEDERTMFQVFRDSVEVLQGDGKLRAVLFQYPPWFDCTHHNVDILRRTKEWMEGFPVALEFRHQSWFTPEMRDKTLSFMRQEGWIHSIADEPQIGEGCVPIVLEPTQAEATMVRFHGRNAAGWKASGQENWREVRYLYRYSVQELLEWKDRILQLGKSTKQIWIIFNNNSGGDAASNARQLMSMLGLDEPPLPEEQMTLF